MIGVRATLQRRTFVNSLPASESQSSNTHVHPHRLAGGRHHTDQRLSVRVNFGQALGGDQRAEDLGPFRRDDVADDLSPFLSLGRLLNEQYDPDNA